MQNGSVKYANMSINQILSNAKNAFICNSKKNSNNNELIANFFVYINTMQIIEFLF